MTRNDRGFTLLEVLVALVVVSFLVLGLAQGVRFGLHAWNAQGRVLARQNGLDAVDRTLRGLIARMQPGGLVTAPTIAGTADRLAFVTELPVGAGDAGPRTAAVALTVDGSHRLLLRWTPDPQAIPLLVPPRHTVVLLSDVERLAISYWLPLSHGGGWVTQWDQPYLPALVRLRIVFRHGDRRLWPDIVAAPMQQRPEG